VQVTRSVGGLATGLAGPHERSGGEWIGWPGPVTHEHRSAVGARLAQDRLRAVWLERDEVAGYYAGYSNGVLWPLFHYMLGHMAQHMRDWPTYRRVNRRFAEATAELYRPGDHVWVHDYQLMLVPEMLRELVPDARIGFFLHIPFPSSAVLRTLPHREDVLRGLLGADLIGFHTVGYLRHFAAGVLRTLGLGLEVDRVRWQGRDVHLGIFPMGVDAKALGELAESREVRERAAEIHGDPGTTVLMGIDRLDYTKGIARRLLAFERLLEQHPELRGKTRLIQVAVPSRGEVGAYEELGHRLNALVGRINGTHGTAEWTPVTYLLQSFDRAEVCALLRASDVLLVTPIRDGMNLVAKEYVAARTDEDGVLVLSELAGAAHEMGHALFVNPYDVDASARVYHAAITMPPPERRRRMRVMRARVLAYDVHRWVGSFLERLAATVPPRAGASAEGGSRASDAEALLGRARSATDLVLLLDYDGTLREFELDPDSASPSEELIGLLRRLAARPRTQLHLVSGRRRADLERWFGELAIGLHAEHGLVSRLARDGEWIESQVGRLPHAERLDALLEDWAARVHGAFVERKEVSLAFHWRASEPGWVERQVNELRLHLLQTCGALGVQVLIGDGVLEVRPAGLTKALAAAHAVRQAPKGALFLALGDDRTDEDLFGALPADAATVRVGQGDTRAAFRLADTQAVLAFLQSLVD
jgi:trehalose 6-phosphate synthase/phosphatase